MANKKAISGANLELALLKNNEKLKEYTDASNKLLNDKIDNFETQTVVDIYDEDEKALILEFATPAQGLIEDTLTSNNEKNALSAKQGKVLNEKINDNVNAINDINSSLLSLIALNDIYIKAVPNQGAKTKLIITCTNAEQILLYVGAGSSGSSHMLLLAPTQSGTLGYKSLGGTNLVPVMRDDKNIEIPTGNWTRGFILSYANFSYHSE